MLVAELIKEVPFHEVKRELLLSDRKLGEVLSQLENYYETLKEVQLSSEPKKNKIQVSREYFDTAFFVPEEEKVEVSELTTFVPVELIISSLVAKEDLADLEKPLIASGVLVLLTFNGTCFSEEERQAKVEQLKQHMEELNA